MIALCIMVHVTRCSRLDCWCHVWYLWKI